MKLSFFVPLFNEDEGIDNLYRMLKPLIKIVNKDYDYEILLLDDGSTDNTWEKLQSIFGKEKNVRLLQHKINQNLGGGLITAIKEASGDLLIPLDADCTYDPMIIAPMLKQYFFERADVITASPYHPRGKVEGLPLYRLIPSFSASLIYRKLTKSQLYTFTSMVRIYKLEDLRTLKIESKGFLVCAEILLKLINNNKKVIEFPATLKVRQFNRSKMRLTKTTLDHLGLMWKVAFGKLIS